MKTLFKIFLLIFIILFAVVAFVLFGLKNQSMLDSIASTALKKSGLDIEYRTLEGNLFDGLDIRGFNYQEKIKANLKLKADFNRLSSGILHIEDINISELWIDEKFLESLTSDSNETKSKESNSESFIKRLIVDHVTFNLIDLHYKEYYISKLDLMIDDLEFDMKKDISAKIKADLKSNIADALISADIKDEKYKLQLEGVPKKSYIDGYLRDQNITIDNSPNVIIYADGDLHKVKANINLSDMNLHYQDIKIDSKDISLNSLYDIDRGDLDAKLSLVILSSVADIELGADAVLNIDDINNTLSFNTNTTIEPKVEYLKDQNLTIKKLSPLKLHAKGDFKNIDFKVKMSESIFSYSGISLNPKDFDIHGSYSIKDGDLNSVAILDINSDIAIFDLDGKLSLNSKDINNSIKIDLVSNLLPVENFVKKELSEQNITIYKMPKLLFKVAGDHKQLDIKAKMTPAKMKYNKITIEPKDTDIDAIFSPKSGELSADINSLIESNVANSQIDANVKLNIKDINNTLFTSSSIRIDSPKREIKEYNITVTKPTQMRVDIKADTKKADALLYLDGQFLYEKVKITPKIHNSSATFDMRSKELDAKLFMDIFSTIGKLKSDTKLSLDLDDINSTLRYGLNLLIKDTKPFKGVDISSLGTIKAKADGTLKELDATIRSPKITAVAKSKDLDKFLIDLDTKKIDIGKIYRYLPKELQKSFVNLKSRGFYKLSNQEAKFTTTLRGFKYGDKVISTEEFDFYLKGEDIVVSNFSLLGNGFRMGLDLQKVGDSIKAKVKNSAINGYADIKLDPLYVDSKFHIDSIDKLIKEINRIYPLNIGIEVDGALDLVANMEADDAKIALTSDKIKFKDGNLVDLNLLSLYNPSRILIKSFDFELKDFEPKEFNRKVRLKRDALITLDRENNIIDIALENLLEFKGSQKGDVATGKLTAKDLMLSYKGYGETKLTTELDMYQSKEQLAVTGFIEFKDTEITYESEFLDVSKDPDIIVITRESKHKKPPPDNFVKNTFLDIALRSKNEMLYKVDAGEIEFEPDIEIRKDFGSLPKITGKVKVLDGWYDLADKRFQIEEGAIAFRGQEGSNPLLDLHVNYEIEDVVIMISIGGDKNRPKLVFNSKPMMSKKDIFSYLLFGMSASETEGAASSANKAAEKIFGRAVAKDLARELNLDRLDMNRNSLGGIDVKAGKKIKRKSIIYYQNKMSESSIIYEKKLSKKWSIETEVGKQGQGVDLFYRKGYK